MTMRLWTAILIRDREARLEEGTYSYDATTAKHDIEAEHPGWRVVALVPGAHGSGSHVFDHRQVASEQQSVDVWATPDPYTHGKPPNCS